MKFLLSFLLIVLIISIGYSQTPKKAEVVSLNGNTIYYEVHGKGEPLILLHGYTQSSKYWLSYLSEYTKEFEVYLIDLKGHGKSGPFKETLSIQSAASEVASLMKHLKLNNIQAIGYSFGGDVLFQLALFRPGMIKSMISIGACGNWNAKDYPDWIEFFSYKNINNLPWMREHQANEAQIRLILDEFPNLKISVSDAEMKSIKAKTLIVLGDQDNIISLEEVSRARKNLPESYLWILPNAEHGAHEGKNKHEFVKVSKAFFKENWKD